MNPKTEINKSDVTKIHSEINQILNQRYNFVAIAITIFGFFVTSFNFKDKLHFSDNGLAITIVFLVILSILNYFIAILTRQFRLLRTYLIVKELSDWESDYSKFVNKNKSAGYTASLRFLLVILGLGMLIVSFLEQYSSMSFDVKVLSYLYGSGWYLLIALMYLLIVFILADKFVGNSQEEELIEKWKEVFGSPNSKKDKV